MNTFSHTYTTFDVLSLLLTSFMCGFMYRGCVGLPNSYAWGNFGVLALGVWAIAQRDSVDAVLMVSLSINFLHVAAGKQDDNDDALSLLTYLSIFVKYGFKAVG